ncbi:hypothetical protein Efla_007187 [Eimeria flavescens]
MRSLFGRQKVAGGSQQPSASGGPQRVGTARKSSVDLEGGAAVPPAASALREETPQKEAAAAVPLSSAEQQKESVLNPQASSMQDEESIGCDLRLREGQQQRSVSAENQKKKGSRESLGRASSSGERSALLLESTSSTSFLRRSTFLNSFRSAADSERLTWLQQLKKKTAKLFCFTGRLGLKVDPFTLAFLDKGIEQEWRATVNNNKNNENIMILIRKLIFTLIIIHRAEHGAKAYLWLGAVLLVQICFELIDRTVCGVPLGSADGELVMLPTWLTLPLPFLLFSLACTHWGRTHSNACLTFIFFLYSPLFLLYSTRNRTRKITEFLLNRPVHFDFALYARRDSIISASQPVLLVIAAYAVALPYVSTLLFCLWVAAWWTFVAVLLPPSKRQGVGHWFFLTFSVAVFLLLTCITIRSAMIAARHRFSMMRQAEKDLQGIRRQTAALVEHSALEDLYGHIAHAETCLREVKLAYPNDISQLEGVISRVLVLLVQAQLCVSHLDEQRAVDPLSGPTNTWAVSRKPLDASLKIAGTLSRRGELAKTRR